MPDVSIVIRTLNEERYLPDLLKAIQSQDTEFTYEIVLIDSGSTDNTLSIANRSKCRILHISRKDFSFGRSLNRACEASNGAYLVMISGHCIPYDEHWLQKLVQPLAQKIVQYCYGRQIGGPCTYWSESRIFSKYFSDQSALPQQGFYCNNANSAILSEVWNRYRFDEELTGLEDIHLAKRLVVDKGKVGYVSDACVYHLHHEDWNQVHRRFEREALALKQICPEVTIRRRDVLRYFLRGLIADIQAGFPVILHPNKLMHIFLYRLNQYSGSYRGNHMRKRMSSTLREAYFYPSSTNHRVLDYLD